MSKTKDITIPDEIEGYSQIRIDVDLTTGKITESTLSSEFLANWIGGYGFAAKVLWAQRM